MKMKRFIIIMCMLGLNIWGNVTFATLDDRPRKQKIVHKKVSEAEFKEFHTAMNKLYGLGASEFSSHGDSVEVTPELVAQLIEALELYYNYIHNDSIMPDTFIRYE